MAGSKEGGGEGERGRQKAKEEEEDAALTEERALWQEVGRQVPLDAHLHGPLHNGRRVVRAGDGEEVGGHLVIGELALAWQVHQAVVCPHTQQVLGHRHVGEYHDSFLIVSYLVSAFGVPRTTKAKSGPQ